MGASSLDANTVIGIFNSALLITILLQNQKDISVLKEKIARLETKLSVIEETLIKRGILISKHELKDSRGEKE
ncbi:hypothetical protein [Sulfolobus polyhedral virus 1]|uniref:Uncharacterized protein n=1 Tax=Sulfolobus polyhedral virus 1 TaxID=1982658 RepID=A0A1W6I177_SPV1|nr:hypothetical protein DT302_gp36 [Sulfolobus polyhedral virus 1]ARM37818.1 hypothetical protein [Sulfolobus polyhedral virus 1]